MARSRFAAEGTASDNLNLDSVSAIIWMTGPRYLLQHREKSDREGVAYRTGDLFGGAREPDETGEAALRRELLEELDFQVVDCMPLLGCTFDLWFEGLKTRKIFFTVEMTQADADRLVLREGQGMVWLQFFEDSGARRSDRSLRSGYNSPTQQPR